MKRYHIIKLLAPIGDHVPTIPDDALPEALGSDAVIAAEAAIDLREWFVDGDERHVARATTEIADALRGLTPQGELAIFGFAPIPLLVALGRILGDKHPARVFDCLRPTATWTWEGPASTDIRFVGDHPNPLEFGVFRG